MNNIRKLASIQEVILVEPIDGADNIEKIQVLGWQYVAKKGEFKVGDTCIYFEIDSFLPADDKKYDFLSKLGTKKMIVDGEEKEGYVLRTIKLKGQISQGLALPFKLFKGLIYFSYKYNPYERHPFIGKDVTEELGILKYEPPIPDEMKGIAKPIPGFIPDTSLPRIQSAPSIIQENADKEFYVTEKLDGASCSIYIDTDNVFGVCSRNWEIDIDNPKNKDNLYVRMANKHRDAIIKLSQFVGPVVLQGEIIGEGIQGNKYRIMGQRFIVYNMYVIDQERFLPYKEMTILLQLLECYGYDIAPVPYIERTAWTKEKTIDDFVELSQRGSVINSNEQAEGLVFTHYNGWGKTSFKVINPYFLIEYNE